MLIHNKRSIAFSNKLACVLCKKNEPVLKYSEIEFLYCSMERTVDVLSKVLETASSDVFKIFI